MRNFLSQPFFVAEVFTGRDGKYVPLEETIRGFGEILDGKHDDLPEDAFYMCGTIDEAVERAAALKGDGQEAKPDAGAPAPAAAAAAPVAEAESAAAAETAGAAATTASGSDVSNPADDAAARSDAATDAALSTDAAEPDASTPETDAKPDETAEE